MKAYRVKVNGQVYDVEIEDQGSNAPQPVKAQTPAPAAPAPAAAPAAAKPAAPQAPKAPASVPAGAKKITAPMPGTIVEIKVAVGDEVSPGQVVAVLEAMKMKNDLPSDVSGKVSAILVSSGQSVQTGEALVTIE